MKILFTANRFPYPPYRGDKLKIYHLSQQLSVSHELHLVTFLQDPEDVKYLIELKKYFSKIHLIPLSKWQSTFNSLMGLFWKEPIQVHYFRSAKMKKKLKELKLKENFDAIHVQHLRMAQYWADCSEIPRILDLPDAYSLYWQRRVQANKGLKKWFAKIEQKRVFKYEKILTKYDLTLVCSKEDANYLLEKHHLDNIAILSNGVDTNTFRQNNHNYHQNNIIVFTGNMDYAPNVDAVIYFAKEILPELRSHFSDIKFIIAGQRPVKKVCALACDYIQVTGFVPNLTVYYQKAAIVVAPLRFGAGTQNKVLEAMSMGIPVVSGKVGFHGLNIKSGEGVFLAETKLDFIDSCLSLLNDFELRQKTGLKGKEIIDQQFSWEAVAKKLVGYFKKII